MVVLSSDAPRSLSYAGRICRFGATAGNSDLCAQTPRGARLLEQDTQTYEEKRIIPDSFQGFKATKAQTSSGGSPL